jgi:hypothetical protein
MHAARVPNVALRLCGVKAGVRSFMHAVRVPNVALRLCVEVRPVDREGGMKDLTPDLSTRTALPRRRAPLAAAS